MNSNRKVTALAAATFLVVASLTGFAGTVAAGNAANSAGNLGIAVEQTGNTGAATITVTAGNQPVEGATVTVTADTDYAGAGEYQTDADGEVSLPAPAETTEIKVVAEYDGATAETKEKLYPPEFKNFGQRVSFFVHSLLGGEDTEGGIGQKVSEFVKKHNPSNDNKADKAGGPENKPDKADKAGGPDKDKGKPDNVGPKDAETTDDDDDSDDDSKSNNGNGKAKGK